MSRVIALLVICCLFAGCSSSGNHRTSGTVLASDTARYAEGFKIYRHDGYIEVDIVDPWNKGRLLQRYFLVERGKTMAANLPQGTLVRVPMDHIVVYNSVHSAIIELLGATDRVVGACEVKYMDTPEMKRRLESGEIADLGQATAPNVERMVELGTEVVLASPFKNAGYGPVEKLGIPVLECADYMESTPLGRAEWIRIYGLLLGKEALADSIFAEAERNYLSLKSLTAGVSHRPAVIPEKRFGSSWYVPAGNSYMARFYEDAGADYLFSYLEGAGTVPLSFETVLDKGIHADFWLIKYNMEGEMSYSDLQTEYTPYSAFDAFKRRNIYTCNTGRNNYYEEFPMRPDYLLKDLVWIFHPELLPDGYRPRYYRKMKE